VKVLDLKIAETTEKEMPERSFTSLTQGIYLYDGKYR